MIQELAAEGFQLITNSPTHNLELGFRCRYLNMIDSLFAEHSFGTATNARILIGRMAIEKVLPLWNKVSNQDSTVSRCLELIDKRAELSAHIVNRELDRLYTHCDDLMFNCDGDISPFSIGYGAIALARDSVNKPMTCDKVNSEYTDLDIEPSENDPSFFAAVAFCGGAPWENESDKVKRFEFWNWWLSNSLQIVSAC